MAGPNKKESLPDDAEVVDPEDSSAVVDDLPDDAVATVDGVEVPPTDSVDGLDTVPDPDLSEPAPSEASEPHVFDTSSTRSGNAYGLSSGAAKSFHDQYRNEAAEHRRLAAEADANADQYVEYFEDGE